MEYFRKAIDGEIIEVNGILPHCHQGWSSVVVIFIGFDADGIGLRSDDVGSIEIALSSLFLRGVRVRIGEIGHLFGESGGHFECRSRMKFIGHQWLSVVEKENE